MPQLSLEGPGFGVGVREAFKAGSSSCFYFKVNDFYDVLNFGQDLRDSNDLNDIGHDFCDCCDLG